MNKDVLVSLCFFSLNLALLISEKNHFRTLHLIFCIYLINRIYVQYKPNRSKK